MSESYALAGGNDVPVRRQAPVAPFAAMLAYTLIGGGVLAALEFVQTRVVAPPEMPAMAWLARLALHWCIGVAPLAAALARLDARRARGAFGAGGYLAAWTVGVIAGVALLTLEGARGDARIDVAATGFAMAWQDRALYVAWPLAFWGGLGCMLHAVAWRRDRGELELHAATIERLEAERNHALRTAAAMRARLEPRFVLDAVSTLQPLYARDAACADQALDALIDFLRASLVRLRRSRSALDDECALAARYASVLLAAAGRGHAVRVAVGRDVGGCDVAPGTLLPFVQRLVAEPARCAWLSIVAGRTGNAIDVRMTVRWREGERPELTIGDLPALAQSLIMSAGPGASAEARDDDTVGERTFVVRWPTPRRSSGDAADGDSKGGHDDPVTR
jgi:hypothetical protein